MTPTGTAIAMGSVLLVVEIAGDGTALLDEDGTKDTEVKIVRDVELRCEDKMDIGVADEKGEEL